MRSEPSAHDVTLSLQVWSGGDEESFDRFASMVYRELRENTQHG